MRAPAGQLHVRPAHHADIQALGEIWQELMKLHEGTDDRFALAPDSLRRWHALAEEMVGRDDGFLLVATLGGQTLGFCLGWVARNPPIYDVSEVGFISEIAVRRSWQRRGVGSALIHAARGWFAARGLGEFQLSTAVWNESAQAFWNKMGGEQLLVRYRFDLGTKE